MALPPRYITVWVGGDLPYTAVLSLASMLAVDPDATIELHHLAPIADRHELGLLRATGRFEVHSIQLPSLLDDELLGVLEQIPQGAHAAASNIVRLALLHRRGGVYLDLDTFLLRPLTGFAFGAFVGLERVWELDRERVERGLRVRHWPATAAWGTVWALKRADTALTRGRLRIAGLTRWLDERLNTEQLNNAVLGAPAGSALTAALLERAKRCDPSVRYALGPNLLHDVVKADHRLATVMSPEVLFAVPPSESHRIFWDRHLQLPPRASVVHYVQSNHRKLLQSVTPGDQRFDRPELFWSLGRAADEWLTKVCAPRGERSTCPSW